MMHRYRVILSICVLGTSRFNRLVCFVFVSEHRKCDAFTKHRFGKSRSVFTRIIIIIVVVVCHYRHRYYYHRRSNIIKRDYNGSPTPAHTHIVRAC